MLQVGVEVDERQSDSELEILRNLVAAFEMVDRKRSPQARENYIWLFYLKRCLSTPTERL